MQLPRQSLTAPGRRRAPPPGVHPVRQQRSRERQLALFNAGRTLLERHDFDALSIVDIAAHNGFSVGSFYRRFRDKEAYFAALQQVVTDEIVQRARDFLDQPRWARVSTPRLAEAIIAMVVQGFRLNRGVIKASLKHASTQPGAWTPIKRSGAAVVDRIVAVLSPRLAGVPAARRELRIRFAMQLVYGTLVNAVLHDPGPIRLEDKRMVNHLAQAFAAYLKLGG